MAGVLVFDRSNGPVTCLVRTREQTFALDLWLVETNTQEDVKVAQCKDFQVFLGYFNSCYLRSQGQEYLVCPRLKCGEWNLIVVGNGWVRVNHFLHHLPVTVREKNLTLRLGDAELKALIRMTRVETSPTLDSQNDPDSQEGRLKIAERPEQGYIGPLKPIKSLKELLLWQPEDQTNVSRIPIQILTKTGCRELLICHDYCGNYKEDVSITCMNSSYKFFHFLHTDIFVYFSHSRVTIPPVSWIDSAHKQGTLMLGTFITEGDEGQKENQKLCSNLNQYVEVLVKIMTHYGFDGYLINIEAECDSPDKMIEFLQTLTLVARSVNHNSRIIWYDSMSTEGKIEWKSCLNPGNLEFLLASDGFFTDYHWKKGMPQSSALVAGQDNWKVFTGTDVYGRGTWGGGGFDTKVGVEDSSCTSCAIFAPGWTLEKVGSDFESFFNAEKLMWAERANPLIDSGGNVFKNRVSISSLNALAFWECFVSDDSHLEESFDWRKVYNSDKFWEVTDQLEFISSYVKTKRSAKVNLLHQGIGLVSHVVGTVEVRGTGPKFDDPYWVQIQVRTSDGRTFKQEDIGYTNNEWKTVQLEIKQEGIEEVTWTEGGFDCEYWQGFYGSRFRKTSVVYKQQGLNILDYFPQKTWNQPFCTWFSLGQGKKLLSKGKEIFSSGWNSLNDFDIFPSMTVLKDFEFDFDTVYHGTNSVKLPPGCFRLFQCCFEAKNLKVKVVYKGNLKLVMQNLELVLTENHSGWTIDYYLLNGCVEDIIVDSQETCWLAGLHLYEEFPEFRLSDLEHKIVWNFKSFDSDFPYFDLQGNFSQLPGFVRHLDVFVNGVFVTRAYRSSFRVCELPANDQELSVLFVAESLNGDQTSCFTLNLRLDDIQKNNPLR